MDNNPGVYQIEYYDSGLEEAGECVVVAFSLLEAMQYALHLHNDNYDGDPIGLESITSARVLTDGPLFFTESAEQWYKNAGLI